MIDILTDALDTIECVEGELFEAKEFLECAIDDYSSMSLEDMQEEDIMLNVADLQGSIEFIKNEIDVLFAKINKELK